MKSRFILLVYYDMALCDPIYPFIGVLIAPKNDRRCRAQHSCALTGEDMLKAIFDKFEEMKK